MTDRMDTSMEYPSFDLQSTHLSFEERRWLFKQYYLYKLDNLIQQIGALHKAIQGYQQFSIIPASLSSSSMIAEVRLDDKHPLYYSSVVNGRTDNQIDQFRLHYQQLFQLVFNDLCTDLNYRIFIIIIEGFIFYSSQTAKQYKSLLTHEMHRCLSSFDIYIRSRSSKLINLLSFLTQLSISSYTIVHTHYENNIGILFQLLPKIQYYLTPTTEYNSIIAVDQYAKHIISPEELRFIDYTMNLKNKSHTGFVQQTPTNDTPVTFGFNLNGLIRGKNGSTTPFPLPFQVYHSLPIIYPYDNNMIYSQKYPVFWTGDGHTNENNNALFQVITVEQNSAEFLFVQRLFYKTVAETDINIAFIERIENPHLWEKFCVHRSYMRRKNDLKNLNENWLFHGTKSDNHHHIMEHGFNRSYCRDYVYYGRGVYFSRYACYSCHYSDRQDLSFLFLCRVLVGYHTIGSNDIRVPPKITLSNGKSIQADSTTDDKTPYTIVCTFHDDQNYPAYIITYMNKMN
ncbi:unnamed protein product [Rotaria sordida]|uniref:Poly [ADP-ribose] polymerase n=1 Tax=Rotaria sordida TaxID=392033 RepID=A0A813TCS0_9BILA|nr:unnamed protein product [Rotaria sordida]CAF3688433.1 unnamed protein product [Rotaria sordida]